ncbi:MAG: NPXTG-anchored protein [Chloroflexi bacterium]|nr:NPXTG-anchored protein [Chloroflexota bacterium]
MKTKTIQSFALALLLLLAIAPWVSANGNNQVIFLTFLPDVSNFGNQSASGIAIVDLHTGEVSVQATSLTPVSGSAYHVWLAGPNLSGAVHIASLTSDGHLPTTITQLPSQEYRYILLTLEADGEAPSAPGEKRSLAGVFPNSEALAPVEGVGSSGQAVVTDPPKSQLPNTGAIIPDRWLWAGAGVLAVLAVVAAGAVIVKRR